MNLDVASKAAGGLFCMQAMNFTMAAHFQVTAGLFAPAGIPQMKIERRDADQHALRALHGVANELCVDVESSPV